MSVFGLGDLAFMGAVGAPVGYVMTDADAAAYVARVEGASGDNQALEDGVRQAIDEFVIGCKADGIWSAIKASCIMAGARTLAGALQPLVGTAPTNNNFVSGDYNRKTGLVGDGSTKYLNSNRAGNADPQNSMHTSIFRTDSTTLTTGSLWGSRDNVNTRNSQCFFTQSAFQFAARISFAALTNTRAISGATNGFIACQRSASNVSVSRIASSQDSRNTTSVSPTSEAIVFFAENSGSAPFNYTSIRLAFYSIGESLDLALLDARVTALINAYAAIL